MRRVAVRPSITGICRSISTMSKRRLLTGLDAFGAVVGDAHLAAHALEEAHRDFLVDGVVLDQQHACRRSGAR